MESPSILDLSRSIIKVGETGSESSSEDLYQIVDSCLADAVSPALRRSKALVLTRLLLQGITVDDAFWADCVLLSRKAVAIAGDKPAISDRELSVSILTPNPIPRLAPSGPHRSSLSLLIDLAHVSR